MKRRLTLRREALSSLTNDDLRELAGADATLSGCVEIRPTIVECPPSVNILISCIVTLDPPRCAGI